MYYVASIFTSKTGKSLTEFIHANVLWKAFDPQYRPTFMTFNNEGKFTALDFSDRPILLYH